MSSKSERIENMLKNKRDNTKEMIFFIENNGFYFFFNQIICMIILNYLLYEIYFL